jgi:hypothetical protein
MQVSRLACATCGRRLAVCTSCGTHGCPDPTCYECFADRMGFSSALWLLRQDVARAAPIEIPTIEAPVFEA